jgi:chromosome segregation ATPase
VTASIWYGRLQSTLEDHSKKLDEISTTLTDAQQGLVVRATRIEEQVKAIDSRLLGVDGKITRLDEWTRDISPRIAKAEFDDAIKERAARIAALTKQQKKQSDELGGVRAELNKQKQQSSATQQGVREVNARLSEIDGDIASIVREASNPETRLPESYKSRLENRVMELRRRLEEIRRQLGF